MIDNSKTEQAKRVVYIFRELLKSRKLTVKEIMDEMIDEFDIDISQRTVQRDFNILQQAIPILEQYKEGRNVFWALSPIYKNPSNFMFIETNELLSFHLLKAHLKTFRGTLFEKETKDLQEKIEILAPGDVFLDDSFYWDQNTGQFDYSKHDKTLRRVISAIVGKEWVRVRYHSIKLETVKEYDVAFRGLFAYSGTLYVVTYFQYFDSYEAIALQGIENIEPAKRIYDIKSDFDFKKFTQKRYGVYTGKLFNVKLQVDKKYRGYFVDRLWHNSQTTYDDEDGNMIIEMRVPIGMDLVSWILGWNKVVKVLNPRELRKKVLSKAHDIIDLYEK